MIGVGVYRVLDLCDQLRVPKCAAPPAVADSRGKVAPVVNRKSCNSPIADGRTVRINPQIDLLAATAGGIRNVVSLEVSGAEPQPIEELGVTYGVA